MVTYYPLTLKEFIRSIITLCQLNRISIYAKQLTKQYLPIFVSIQQLASHFLGNLRQHTSALNNNYGKVEQIVNKHSLAPTYTCDDEQKLISSSYVFSKTLVLEILQTIVSKCLLILRKKQGELMEMKLIIQTILFSVLMSTYSVYAGTFNDTIKWKINSSDPNILAMDTPEEHCIYLYNSAKTPGSPLYSGNTQLYGYSFIPPQNTFNAAAVCDIYLVSSHAAYIHYLITQYHSCPTGTTLTGPVLGLHYLCSDTCVLPQVYNSAANQCTLPDKNQSFDSSCSVISSGTRDPIKYATGNKVLFEKDYAQISDQNFNFNRYFNMRLSEGERIGKNWFVDVYSQIISSQAATSAGSQAIVIRSDGLKLPFTYNGSAWLPNSDITDELVELKNSNGIRSGWIYTVDITGDVETFHANGKLVSITDRKGLTQNITYTTSTTSFSDASTSGLPISNTDALGRKLSFTYNLLGRISTMTNPAGGVYHYTYSVEGNNNLISVTYPDGTVKQYLYEDPAHPNALTGVIDENNSRYMTYTYDASGRAVEEISPTFGTNVNHYQMNYNPGVSTTVTDPRGSVRTYNFTTILGVIKSTGQSQPAGSGCAASAAALTYDTNGNIASRTDFNGNKTTYAYDLTRNTETSRTEGLTTAGAATASTRTITTTWHATWRLPLTISEYAGSAATGTPLKTTTYTYDAKGNITSVTEADPVNNKTRSTTTTYTYSTAVPGLVLSKVVDGPRTDVSDLTTYQYYPHDATCTASSAAPITDPITGIAPDNFGCRGQLMSVSNALNQTTTYDRYNHHGQVEQMTDANGLVTTYSYDLRQRILSHTVGTETTSYAYDNVGQLTTLTLPDGSYLNYTWDAAHRLTDITDSLSNHIHYTLDTEGNRTQEDITDPNNVLTRTLSRSYDALNRMQQLTGVE